MKKGLIGFSQSCILQRQDKNQVAEIIKEEKCIIMLLLNSKIVWKLSQPSKVYDEKLKEKNKMTIRKCMNWTTRGPHEDLLRAARGLPGGCLRAA